uniref:Phosphatidylinositol 3-kinase catalytic subunit type 3 n=1 Tax=Aceria tosichella TaxID=561515 RepID=A0A6G1SI40_9ACAR
MSIVYSINVKDECLKIKIGCLEGKRPLPNLSELIKNPHLVQTGLDDNIYADLLIECCLESDTSPLCPPMQTTYKYFTNQWNWNEWIEFPIAICDLPRDTIIVIKILDSVGPSRTVILGKAFVSVFGHQGIVRTGLYDLRVWFENELQQALELGENILTASLSGQDELDRLYELKSNYHNGQTVKIDWLDKLTFLEMEKMTQRMKADSKNMFISVEFPKALIENTIDVPILYNEITLDDQRVSQSSKTDLVMINDPELGLENIIEGKHHRLSRSARSCISDKDLKPNAIVRDQLNLIVSYPPTKALTSEEQDLIWKFRYYLMSQKKALTKFLKCLNWQAQAEVKIALELLASWQPMDTQDALELLTPQFQHPQVRSYAVARLSQATDEDLLLYLLQLVQALKYENYDLSVKLDQGQTQGLQQQNLQLHQQLSGLVLSPKDLQKNAKKQEETDKDDMKYVEVEKPPAKAVSSKQQQQPPPQQQQLATSGGGGSSNNMTQWDLSTFLIDRCVQDDFLANYFYWYLVVEIENFSQNIGELNSTNATSIASNQKNMQAHKIYTDVMDRFIRTLSSDQEAFKKRRDFLSRQRLFVDKLVSLMKMVSKENKNRLGKIEKLKESLADPEILKFDFTHMDPPLSLPLDPIIKIQGILPQKATLFKSQLMPCRLTLRTTIYEKSIRDQAGKARNGILSTSPLTETNSFPPQMSTESSPTSESPFLEYNIIFKHGDDLRQDQLILQTITLMDKLLRRENLDLKLTPYRVLATSTRHGFVQYIESMSLAEVRANEGSIQNFFRRYAPSPDSPYGIAPDVMDTYVRSCAGYCVITYLLGVGDRHLDNLLLTKTGKLFHIDFGYILGRDPKPMPPPPMKLTREMVEAMGGTSSDLYREFLNLSHTAFLHLRRHSNLILNLFSLMVDANVPDIALEPDKTVKKVQDKFRLDLSDEEAVHYIQNLIEISVSDVMAVLVEQIHKIAQYWRK